MLVVVWVVDVVDGVLHKLSVPSISDMYLSLTILEVLKLIHSTVWLPAGS